MKIMNEGQRLRVLCRSCLKSDGVASRLATILVLSGPITAQCLSWSTDFGPAPKGLNGPALALAVYDDGSGPALYAGGEFTVAGGVVSPFVARWDGTSWSAVGNGLTGPVGALCVYDFGTGPMLYAGGEAGMSRWDGVTWFSNPGMGIGADPYPSVFAMEVFDFGQGPQLIVAGRFRGAGFAPTIQVSNIARYDGVRCWPLGPPGSGTAGIVESLAVWDDGTGPALYIGGWFTWANGWLVNGIARWDGANWSNVGSGVETVGSTFTAIVKALTVFDDDGGEALYCGGYFDRAGGIPMTGLARWNGTSWSEVAGGPVDYCGELIVFDDGTGPALHMFGIIDYPDGPDGVARWDGVDWTELGAVGGADQSPLCVFDDGIGGPDLYVGGYGMLWAGGIVSSRGIGAWQGCGVPIDTFCFGDRTVQFCPCDNYGAPGHGCAWRGNPSGALLAHQGTVSPDALVLTASGMPLSGTSMFIKADDVDRSAPFYGDGLLCLKGNFIRLGTKNNVNGSAQYPGPGDAPLSIRGHTPVGSGAIAYYQARYRNAADFCTPETFNTTNGVRVVW